MTCDRPHRGLRQAAPALLGFLLLVSVLAGGPSASAQVACCTSGGDCQDVAGQSGCNALGGVILEGQVCVDDPCLTGACCSEMVCGQFDAFLCIAGGRDFIGAGVSCSTDPCDIGSGACCTDSGCQQMTEENCLVAEGTFVGPGTICAINPCEPGACCTPGECADVPQFECNVVDGTFLGGAQCLDFLCTAPPVCPEGSLFAHPAAAPDFFAAGVSELGASVRRFDNFSGVTGPIEGLTWWGLDLDLVAGEFIECDEANNEFIITFHENAAGQPGAVACSHTVTASRTPLALLYAGFQLNAYTVTLPEPCAVTQGWVSIVGAGDPECWFLWMSSDEGDGASFCDVCDPQVETFDLGFCFAGTPGGAFGACCDQSSGNCGDGVDILDCTEQGLQFTADTFCDDLVPACASATGACCDPIGNCTIELPDDCTTTGGTWLGADTTCDQCPSMGACCIDAGECFVTSVTECLGSGFTWTGQGGTCAECPEPPACDEDVLLAQPPHGPSGFFLAATSEASTAFRRWENFSGVSAAIESLTWWGLDLEFDAGAFIECIETANDFGISFHGDNAGVPGPTVCSYSLTASSTPVGFSYLGAQLNEYHVDLPEPCELADGWVSIVGLGDPDCLFLWMSSPEGDGESFCSGCDFAVVTVDLSMCLDDAAADCPADLDGDGEVRVPDLIILLGAWGVNPGHPADFDGDGLVRVPDLIFLLGEWGQCG